MNKPTQVVALSIVAAVSLWAMTVAELYLFRVSIHATTIPTRTVESDVFMLIAIILVGPVIEETLFRFLVMKVFLKRFSAAISIPVSTASFMLSHTQYLALDAISLAAMANIATAGLVFGYLYVSAGTLLAPITAHAVSNALATLLPTLFLYEAERLPAPALVGFAIALMSIGAWSLLSAGNALARLPPSPNAQTT